MFSLDKPEKRFDDAPTMLQPPTPDSLRTAARVLGHAATGAVRRRPWRAGSATSMCMCCMTRRSGALRV